MKKIIDTKLHKKYVISSKAKASKKKYAYIKSATISGVILGLKTIFYGLDYEK